MAKKFKFRFYVKLPSGYRTSYSFRADQFEDALKMFKNFSAYKHYTGKYIMRDNKPRKA